MANTGALISARCGHVLFFLPSTRLSMAVEVASAFNSYLPSTGFVVSSDVSPLGLRCKGEVTRLSAEKRVP